MSKKYVITNCPAILPMTKLCDSENLNKPSTYCQDCTDCVIKQIVKKCKYWQNRWTDDIDERDGFDQIIELLDIQEVE